MTIDRALLRSNARSFLLAAERALEQRPIEGGIQSLIVPAVVCCAFSIELSSKCMSTAWGHDLKDLYDGLSEPQRSEILRRMEMDESGFTACLQNSASLFKDWRYLHEHVSGNVKMDFLQKLARICIEMIEPNT